MAGLRPNTTSDETSDYYVSITDMMIGLLFLFIILLTYFALQLRDTTQELVTAEQTRNELLYKVEHYLDERGVDASVDVSRGVLRLPTEILFDKGSEIPTPAGEKVIALLGQALDENLGCYAFRSDRTLPASCSAIEHALDTILVEGHTDSDPVTPTDRIRDNWDLSAARATNTLRRLMVDQPDLSSYISAPLGADGLQPIFSVAGYADQRPVRIDESTTGKAANRRIDLRFIMSPPRPPEAQPIQQGLDRSKQLGDPILIGKHLRFRSQDSTDSYLRDGWSSREDWGVWTVGDNAELVLPVKNLKAGRTYTIAFDLLAYVPETSPHRTVDVSVNGVHRATWRFDGPKNAFSETLVLPTGSLEPGAPIGISFHLSNPVAPLELGESKDERRLSIGLAGLRISNEN